MENNLHANNNIDVSFSNSLKADATAGKIILNDRNTSLNSRTPYKTINPTLCVASH